MPTLIPGDGDPRHGQNGYSNLGCRCDVCRQAHADYAIGIRETRARRIGRDPSLAPHGKSSTYTNWGCRCDDCRRANTDERRKWQIKNRKWPVIGGAA